MERVHLFISGKVQGVSFRYFAKINADKLNLKGFARNIDDKVEIVIEGNQQALEEFVKHCEKGPPHAKVESIQKIMQEPSNHYSSFEIRSQ